MSTAKLDGRRRRGDHTRELVLASAMRLASVEGLDGLTFGAVAEASGVPKASIQTLFRTREALQIQTLALAAQRIGAAILARVPARARGVARLRTLADGWFAVVEDGLLPGGCLLTAATSEYRARPGAVRDAILGHRAQWKELLATAARAAAADGSLPKGTDLDALVFHLLALEGAANGGRHDAREFALAREVTRRLLA